MTEKKEKKRHTFAICAYGDSPYLEECMASLVCQRRRSELICCTSTPSPYIAGLAEKYRIPLYVREGKSGIREDWLFAVSYTHLDVYKRQILTRESRWTVITL